MLALDPGVQDKMGARKDCIRVEKSQMIMQPKKKKPTIFSIGASFLFYFKVSFGLLQAG